MQTIFSPEIWEALLKVSLMWDASMGTPIAQEKYLAQGDNPGGFWKEHKIRLASQGLQEGVGHPSSSHVIRSRGGGPQDEPDTVFHESKHRLAFEYSQQACEYPMSVLLVWELIVREEMLPNRLSEMSNAPSTRDSFPFDQSPPRSLISGHETLL